ncbi:MAG: BTAD domain-containing putative transcriptional regulator [Caldilineaceae bacterium]
MLGSTEVKLGNDQISSFGSRKAQALLYYLATTDGVCTRDTVAGLLWPEMPEKKAKSNLRVAIASVKQQIGAYLNVSSNGLALNRKLTYESDVETFRDALAVALRQRNLEEIEAALTLYKGEFLQGFHISNAAPFEEWLVQQREHLRMLAIQGLESLGAFCLDQKAYATGLAAARQLLMLEPWHENAHRQIMVLLALSNQRSAALAHFEVCQRQLRDELGVAPAPETVALYESIKTGDFEQPADPLLQRAAEILRVQAASPPAEVVPLQPPLPPNNISAPLAGFVGRTSELTFACQQFTEFESRLLTILGIGGIGKSSLAQRIAQHMLHAHADLFPHGIFMVALLGADANSDPNDAGDVILMAIAEAIGAEFRGDAPYLTQLITYLRARRLLLILDNLEHLIAGAQTIAKLLAQAPHIRMLITSRTRLRVNGETTLVLGKLSLPSAPNPLEQLAASSHVMTKSEAAWQRSDAVAMFVQRAQVMNPQFTVDPQTLDAIVRICTLVDGLPLGIELAVSWLHALNCSQIAREIELSLDFLTTDLPSLPPAQRALRSVFERSWQLLAPADQELLAKLTIFPFTFHPHAAQFVANASLPMLAKLVSHSLLSVNSTGAYFMHRSVREFALTKLSSQPDQYVELQKQHARYYLNFLIQRDWPSRAPNTL